MKDLDWSEFMRVELRAGTIIAAQEFPEARKPAYKLEVDFGPAVGTLKSSAQITDLYSPADLVGRQVIAVTNFPDKQIGPFMSQCLVTGLVSDDGVVTLAVPDRPVRNGTRLA